MKLHEGYGITSTTYTCFHNEWEYYWNTWQHVLVHVYYYNMRYVLFTFGNVFDNDIVVELLQGIRHFKFVYSSCVTGSHANTKVLWNNVLVKCFYFSKVIAVSLHNYKNSLTLSFTENANSNKVWLVSVEKNCLG